MSPRGTFRLDRRNGRFLGVCAGLARQTGIDALWFRVAFVVGTLAGAGILVLIYLAVGFLADPLMEAEDNRLGELKGRLERIDRRLRAIEARVTSPAFRVAREIDALDRS
ncbi:MAG: PspC domain-containing protein [Sphingomonadaceae bacterium]|uniref:PspC domain-containing protein n=1 Tax=Thermaurantiacus sp. TaxID=2820283 RepID=UPI00298ED8AC|nr:PspC domain-containing protein [Thermaurantiacus sp.]MCS6985910.1 PspC domain-containing protein [Sphingomonadaceae bacterium]MDW8414874.1 PspC domain-containing protein [Thermaurantiacus sp.]